MRGQLHGLASRLGAAVNGNGELVRPGGDEELRGTAALRAAQQDPLAGRAEGEQAVEAGRLEKPDERVERVFVQQLAGSGERRHSGSESASKHEADFKLRTDERAANRAGGTAASGHPRSA